MGYSIHVYANDGSPIGLIPPDIYERGVGGAELSLMTWAETMVQRGHEVTIYNNPRTPGAYEGVTYRPQADFKPREHRDVFIAWRSPNPFTRLTSAEVRLFWSTDQYTVGNFATDIFPIVDRVICISPYHVKYHKQRYGINGDKIGYFDLGVRQQDYEQEVEKVPGRAIWCSVPDRGLSILHSLWPEIKKRVPHASLVITSDYTLWGSPGPRNHQFRLDWMHVPDVQFLGNINRRQLAREQLAAEVMPYTNQPTQNDIQELFCISAAECQVAGAYPITTSYGSLPTTNKWGCVIQNGNMMDASWREQFIEATTEAIIQPLKRNGMQKKAARRFDWQAICAKWEHLIETGKFS